MTAEQIKDRAISEYTTGKFFSYRESFVGGFQAGYAAASQPSGAVWVRASDIKIEPREVYYAKLFGQDSFGHDCTLQGTGTFQESDGTFFWKESGFVPVLKSEHHELLILDESIPATLFSEGEDFQAQYADALEWIAIILSPLQELIRLKELKDKEGKTQDYEQSQPKGWRCAKSVVKLWEEKGNHSIPLKLTAERDYYKALAEAANAVINFSDSHDDWHTEYSMSKEIYQQLKNNPVK